MQIEDDDRFMLQSERDAKIRVREWEELRKQEEREAIVGVFWYFVALIVYGLIS